MARCNDCGKSGIEPEEVIALRFQCECGRYWMTVKKPRNSLDIKLEDPSGEKAAT